MRSAPRFALLSVPLALTFLFGSCATRLPSPQAVDVLAPLDPAALVFIEAGGEDVARLAKGLEAVKPAEGERTQLEETARALGGLARHGRRFGLALLGESAATVASGGSGGDGGGTSGGTSGGGGGGGGGSGGAPGLTTEGDKPSRQGPTLRIPPFEAAIDGDFTAFGLWLNFITARGWRQEKGEWKNRSLDLAVALPKRGLLVAAKHEASGPAARAMTTAPSPLPQRYAGLVEKGIVAWIPDPLNRLSHGLGLGQLDALDLPPFGLLILATTGNASPSRSDDGGPSLDLDIRFVLPDAETAKLLMPAIRVGWFFLARNLPLEGEATFGLEGDSLRIRGLKLPLAKLVTLLMEKPPATTAEPLSSAGTSPLPSMP